MHCTGGRSAGTACTPGSSASMPGASRRPNCCERRRSRPSRSSSTLPAPSTRGAPDARTVQPTSVHWRSGSPGHLTTLQGTGCGRPPSVWAPPGICRSAPKPCRHGPKHPRRRTSPGARRRRWRSARNCAVRVPMSGVANPTGSATVPPPGVCSPSARNRSRPSWLLRDRASPRRHRRCSPASRSSTRWSSGCCSLCWGTRCPPGRRATIWSTPILPSRKAIPPPTR